MYQQDAQDFTEAASGYHDVSPDLQAVLAREAATVFVLDADPGVRSALADLVATAGWRVQSFDSAEDFLARPLEPAPGCLILDAVLPGLGGLDLQQRLNRSGAVLSTILIMRCPDLPAAVRAMKAGAVEVLAKPVDAEALLCAVAEAIEQSRAATEALSRLTALRVDYATLSGREREVMSLIVSGLLNKQVGGELGISEITVKAHRGQVMRKMRARSFADLVHKAARLSPARDWSLRPSLAGHRVPPVTMTQAAHSSRGPHLISQRYHDAPHHSGRDRLAS